MVTKTQGLQILMLVLAFQLVLAQEHPSLFKEDATTTERMLVLSQTEEMGSCRCPVSWLGNKRCDSLCNNKKCRYDLGDCKR